MKKIDAYWEQQNLNKKVLEIEFDVEDLISCLDTLEDDYLNYEYIVAKVPKLKIDFVHKLEESGFKFMETQIEMTLNLKKFVKLSTFSSKLQFQAVESIEQFEELLSQIDETLFVTDRISLDPLLGIDFAHKRYSNWIKTGFLSEDTLIIEVVKNTDKIGFFYLTKKNDKDIHAVLVSVYKNFRRRGIGLKFLEEICFWLVEEGYRKVNTRVSSNNLEALRANLSVGFEIKEIYYILRKITR